MKGLKEIAKFACGAEAWHAFSNAVLGLTGTTVTVFGVTWGPTWMAVGAIVNAVIALALGLYAWRHPTTVTGAGPAARTLSA
ncbi:MAG: hypothetical protein KatS3mg114_0937 [Planctomycetaceae bacterium]|jgi:hypothetical protein|nr:MAG: hypothetical protein KatS3mg114_0937 [Planctomycetaceae bacterium]